MESTVYRETLSVTATEISDEDKALGRRYNEVLWRALEQAETYLIFGPETARLQITFLAVRLPPVRHRLPDRGGNPPQILPGRPVQNDRRHPRRDSGC